MKKIPLVQRRGQIVCSYYIIGSSYLYTIIWRNAIFYRDGGQRACSHISRDFVVATYIQDYMEKMRKRVLLSLVRANLVAILYKIYIYIYSLYRDGEKCFFCIPMAPNDSLESRFYVYV